nr:Atrophin-1 incomplete domain containing protein [Pandoravirus aubagnensis]
MERPPQMSQQQQSPQIQQQQQQQKQPLPHQPERAKIVPTSAPRSAIRPTSARPVAPKPSIVPTSATAVSSRPLIVPTSAPRVSTNVSVPPGNRAANVVPRSAPTPPTAQPNKAVHVGPPPIIRPAIVATTPDLRDVHAHQQRAVALPAKGATVHQAPPTPSPSLPKTIARVADDTARLREQPSVVQSVAPTSPTPLVPLEKVASTATNTMGRQHRATAPPPSQTMAATALAPLPSDGTPAKGQVRTDHATPLHGREPPHMAKAPFGHFELSPEPLLDASDVHDPKKHSPTQSSTDDVTSTPAPLPPIDPLGANTDKEKGSVPDDLAAGKNVDHLNAEPNVTDHEGEIAAAAADTSVWLDMGSDRDMVVDAASEPNDRAHQVDDDSGGNNGIIVNGDDDDDADRRDGKECDDNDDGSHRFKRQRMTEIKDERDELRLALPKDVDASRCGPTACVYVPGYEADPAPEPAETRDAHYTGQQLCQEEGEGSLCDQRRLADHTNATTTQKTALAIETKGGNKYARETTNRSGNNGAPRATTTMAHKTDAALTPPACIVYSVPPADERRAKYRRSAAGPSVQVSPCGRVIDRPVPRETVLVGPWSLPPQADADWAGGGSGSGGDTNPTRTAVRFWLTRPVESVRVIGAPCEFCLAVGGALIEPHSQGGVLEMGDVCDTECRPSRMPAGVAGDRLNRALRAVRCARINGQAIAPGVLDLGGIETALVFRGPLDRDTLDRMVVRFAAYNVWRECRSVDGKTITDGRWLYGS